MSEGTFGLNADKESWHGERGAGEKLGVAILVLLTACTVF